RGRDLVLRTEDEERILINRDEIFLRGLHNVENILAAFAACIACRAPLEKIRNSVSEFRGVEHRIEYVSEIRGIKFFNDSKATSVDATAKALE
ncbi:UDP-N-acetylmuramoyl-L-alanine--D-glutamate ligase, partial [Escherichia coli]|nr:UDP-N-acetylmuramoyl-L-alanine--D-glutamate ligase [Escherichia coli]